MSKVLECDGTYFTNYVEKYPIGPYNDAWVEVKLAFTTAALDAWVDQTDGSTFAFFIYLAGSNTLGIIGVDDEGSGPEYFLFNQGGQFDAETSPGPEADAYHTFEVHFERNVTVKFYYDGTLKCTITESRNQALEDVLFGLFNFGFNGALSPYVDNKLYIDEIKIGTTRHGTDIFSEDFEGATPLANFDFTDGSLTVMDDPFGAAVEYTDSGTLPLALTPSGVDVPTGSDGDTEYLRYTPSSVDVATYVDSDTKRLALTPSGVDFGPFSDAGTELFHFTPSATDHYCPQKVEFEGEMDGRWAGQFRNRWAGSAQGRWEGQFLGVGEGFAC